MSAQHEQPEPTKGFFLTSQQQDLLFAALSSHSNKANPSPGTALSMSPASLDQSPTEAQESSFLDYDISFNPNSAYDSTYDFDLTGLGADGGEGKMIGDLPGASPDKSDGPEKEKRGRSDDDDDQESSPKRRESTEKVPKKPGRKPLTSEPSSKRKAQNRAAQRAFRERKEKHVKDLETKVEELQKASEFANHENQKLRSQINELTSKLDGYKKKVSILSDARRPTTGAGFQWGNAAVNNLSDVNFNFEFPKFGALPGLSTAQPLAAPNHRTSPAASPAIKSSPKATVSASWNNSLDILGQPTPPLSNDDYSAMTGLSSSGFAPNSIPKGNSFGSLNSIGIKFGTTENSSPSISSISNAGASSCGTSPEPSNHSPTGFKPLDNLATIGEEKQPTVSTAPIKANGISPEFSEWLSVQPNASFDPQLFGNYREPQDSVLHSNYDSVFMNDPFDLDFLTPFNAPEAPVQPPKKDILAEIDAQKMDDSYPATAPRPPANFSGKLLTCNKIWEKLQTCPEVQKSDVDLEGLCKDLKDKAKCTGSGPMVNEKDFKNIVHKYVTADCATQALGIPTDVEAK